MRPNLKRVETPDTLIMFLNKHGTSINDAEFVVHRLVEFVMGEMSYIGPEDGMSNRKFLFHEIGLTLGFISDDSGIESINVTNEELQLLYRELLKILKQIEGIVIREKLYELHKIKFVRVLDGFIDIFY